MFEILATFTTTALCWGSAVKAMGQAFPSWLSSFGAARLANLVLYLIYLPFSRKLSLACAKHASDRQTNHSQISLIAP